MSQRSAPAVQVLCTGGPVWRRLWALLPALASGLVAFWALLHGGQAVALSLAVAAAIAAFTTWLLRGQTPAAARLVWDGAIWQCNGTPVLPEVMLDLGGWLLLRLRQLAAASPDEGFQAPRWLAVASSDAAQDLHALRVALFATPPHAAVSAEPQVWL